MLIGFDYKFEDGMGEDAGLIAATCIFAFFVAVSHKISEIDFRNN